MKTRLPYPLLVISIVSCIMMLLLLFLVPPSYQLTLGPLSLSITLPFFLLLFLVIFGLMGFVLRSILQGILSGSFVTIVFLLRFFGITHWFFLLLLVLFYIVLEIGLYQKS